MTLLIKDVKEHQDKAKDATKAEQESKDIKQKLDKLATDHSKLQKTNSTLKASTDKLQVKDSENSRKLEI